MSQVLNAMAKLNEMNSRIKKPYSWAWICFEEEVDRRTNCFLSMAWHMENPERIPTTLKNLNYSLWKGQPGEIFYLIFYINNAHAAK